MLLPGTIVIFVAHLILVEGGTYPSCDGTCPSCDGTCQTYEQLCQNMSGGTCIECLSMGGCNCCEIKRDQQTCIQQCEVVPSSISSVTTSPPPSSSSSSSSSMYTSYISTVNVNPDNSVTATLLGTVTVTIILIIVTFTFISLTIVFILCKRRQKKHNLCPKSMLRNNYDNVNSIMPQTERHQEERNFHNTLLPLEPVEDSAYMALDLTTCDKQNNYCVIETETCQPLHTLDTRVDNQGANLTQPFRHHQSENHSCNAAATVEYEEINLFVSKSENSENKEQMRKKISSGAFHISDSGHEEVESEYSFIEEEYHELAQIKIKSSYNSKVKAQHDSGDEENKEIPVYSVVNKKKSKENEELEAPVYSVMNKKRSKDNEDLEVPVYSVVNKKKLDEIPASNADGKDIDEDNTCSHSSIAS